MLESVMVHFLKEQGLSFSQISEKTGLPLNILPSLYVKSLTAKKKFLVEKSKDPVIFRKRINLKKKNLLTEDVLIRFKNKIKEEV